MVGRYLNRSVSIIGYPQAYAIPPLVEYNPLLFGDNRTGDFLGRVFGFIKQREKRLGRNRQERAVQRCFQVTGVRANGVMNRHQKHATLHCRFSTNSSRRNWVVDVPVLKRSLNLYLMQKRWDAWQDVAPAQQGFAMVHELRYGIDAIPNTFLQLRGDESDCFRLVEAQAPC